MAGVAQLLGSGWVKIVNPSSGPDPAPGQNKLLRIWSDDWDRQLLALGKAGAVSYMTRMLPQWNNFRNWGTVVWELPNEPACNGEVELRALNDFTVEALRIASDNGITCGALNLPEGNPGGDPAGGEVDERAIRWKLEFLVPTLRAILTGGHYWEQHAYWYTPIEGPTGEYHAWRIIRIMSIFNKIGVDCTNLKVLLSEAGLDGKIKQGIGDSNGGWQAQSNAETYIEEVAQFETRARTVPQVKAYFLFDVGYQPPWATYNHPEDILKRIAGRLAQVTPPVGGTMFPIIGKTFSSLQFADYLKTVKPFVGLKYIVVHHTAIPDAATWIKYTQDYWVNQLQSYYSGQGWTACPHLFISDRGVLVENPLNLNGRGVAGHNTDSVHIETVGNFMQTPPMGPTLDFLVNACASLLKWAGLGIGGLTNHRILQTVYTECPGDAFVATWGEFQSKVNALMSPVIDQAALETFLGNEAQRDVIPLNPAGAFEKYATPKGWLAVSRGFDIFYGGVKYSVQVYRCPSDTTVQFIVFCESGQWDRVRHFTRRN